MAVVRTWLRAWRLISARTFPDALDRMTTAKLLRAFNPATLLWQTRGRHWDYEFVAIPDEPCLFSWWDVFNQIFGGSPEPRTVPIFRYGEFPGPRPRPFVAVAFSDSVLRDEHGRPICHYLVWFPELPAGPEFDKLRTGLPEDWPKQILSTMRSYFESSDVFGLGKSELRDMFKDGKKLGEYLVARVQRNGNALELQGIGTGTLVKWDRVGIVSPIESKPPKPQPDGKLKDTAWLIAAAAALGLLGFQYLYLVRQPPSNERISIAVMPFEHDQANRQLATFNKTRLKEVISKLATENALDVSPYDKVSEYIGRKLILPELAERLRVRYIVTGTLQSENDYVRATITVTDTNMQRPWQNGGVEQRVRLQTGWEDAIVNQIIVTTRQSVADSPGHSTH